MLGPRNAIGTGLVVGTMARQLWIRTLAALSTARLINRRPAADALSAKGQVDVEFGTLLQRGDGSEVLPPRVRVRSPGPQGEIIDERHIR
ncbi:hypothetical protein CFBP8129_46850 (plasmid) [Xanthomonas hortorum pv. gardneri]|uniref:Uncharacterized protein n=1 Tax=Xanthomonas hortorum pv. gardneri TaxID=2754056 RepID=A0A6V7FH97_9XANT|nr:hypothetical protein CFBP8129_46850 [Xanthomonas hortorum pv. gardneri]CAD0363109.1 hypothetical protein CFBP8129_46850 [Xanthomonas hortorum pv. gardneri]